MKLKVEIIKTSEFEKWYRRLDLGLKRRIDARLILIQEHGHFGTVNRFDGITELKWQSGMRVYTAERLPQLFVLLGGNKNGQEKDIEKAKKILSTINATRSH